MDSRDVQEAYSALASVYIGRLGSLEVVHADDLALIARHMRHVRGPVLDVGCGPGHLTGFLHDLGCDVTGIDPVPEFIDHALRTHPEARFELTSLADLVDPSAPATAAGVLAWYSLIHFSPDQLGGALDALRHLTRPGAPVVVGFFTGEVCETFEHKVTTAYRWPVDELAARLEETGFVEVERLQRAQNGERRPHGVIACRAV